MDAPPGVFQGSLDRFNGVTIDSSKEYEENEHFPDKLEKSLAYWKEQKRRAIWFTVKTEHSSWVPHLTKVGFEFHHAKQGYVVLYRWLPNDEYENIPVYSHTMLGVGGLVVNENNEVLVVCERFSLIPNSWKLPGGYAEPQENIVDAAIREVREETGVECEFNTVISIRHAHGGIFGCSDIYCVVALSPKSLDLTRCEREIAKLQWMPIDEYLQHPNVHETNRHFLRCYMDYKKRGIRFTCEIGKHQVLKKEYCLYYMKPIDEDNGS
ncbi:uncharacterized protein LOC106084171 [Stomoxys calcitrans]|uniref:uncharacterized protein LOC106084171 n=1 Tax=Stomoxys calcitrans TaxID=35570 RepID=UPI0027E333BD|nr:uncharacterized protein LOC106084171 [Stomoxys calcitrans]